jgi:hypothetical protein
MLAHERLLTTTYPYYMLKTDTLGPAGGFEYKLPEESTNRRQDGYGIARQHTLSSIAGDEQPNHIFLGKTLNGSIQLPVSLARSPWKRRSLHPWTGR